MRDGNDGARRQKRPTAVPAETAVAGSAIRQAFLRNVEVQQLSAGFAATPARGATLPPREKPRGRRR